MTGRVSSVEWSAVREDGRRVVWGEHLPPEDSTARKLVTHLGYRLQSRTVTEWEDADV